MSDGHLPDCPGAKPRQKEDEERECFFLDSLWLLLRRMEINKKEGDTKKTEVGMFDGESCG